jgi:choloylglycine hydrolase
MELGTELPWAVWTEPRVTSKGERFDAVLIGVRAVKRELVSDGMNIAGLTVSVHTFVTSEYQRASSSDSTISYSEVAHFLLKRYATCAEVIEGLTRQVRVIAPRGLDEDPKMFVHWAVQDAEGQSLVVEYEGGELRLHNNTLVGVMTNDPGYEWHTTNTRAFAGLSSAYRAANPVISPGYTSHGWNLLGLPGDLGPPARFVRTFVLRQLALQRFPPRSLAEAFVLVEKLIGAVGIPKGAVGPNAASERSFDYTQWSAVKLPGERFLFSKTYQQSVWRKIDIKRVKFDGRRIMRLDAKATGGVLVDEHLDLTETLNQATRDTSEGLVSVGLGNDAFRAKENPAVYETASY